MIKKKKKAKENTSTLITTTIYPYNSITTVSWKRATRACMATIRVRNPQFIATQAFNTYEKYDRGSRPTNGQPSCFWTVDFLQFLVFQHATHHIHYYSQSFITYKLSRGDPLIRSFLSQLHVDSVSLSSWKHIVGSYDFRFRLWLSRSTVECIDYWSQYWTGLQLNVIGFFLFFIENTFLHEHARFRFLLSDFGDVVHEILEWSFAAFYFPSQSTWHFFFLSFATLGGRWASFFFLL